MVPMTLSGMFLLGFWCGAAFFLLLMLVWGAIYFAKEVG